MFSDIPTTTQAITKLKEMRQAENESILAFNQRYKTLVERVEGRPIEKHYVPSGHGNVFGNHYTSIKKIDKEQHILGKQACTDYSR